MGLIYSLREDKYSPLVEILQLDVKYHGLFFYSMSVSKKQSGKNLRPSFFDARTRPITHHPINDGDGDGGVCYSSARRTRPAVPGDIIHLAKVRVMPSSADCRLLDRCARRTSWGPKRAAGL